MNQQPRTLPAIPLKEIVSSCNRGGGFTIIELLITVSIVGVLLAVGIPSLQNFLLTQKVRTASSDIHVGILLARSEAIKRNVDVELERNTDWSNGWDVEVKSSGEVIRTQDPFPGLTITCNTDTDTAAEPCPTTVEFARTGRPTSFIEFRVFVAGKTGVPARCVSLRMSGVPRNSVDTDQDSSDGCD